MAARLNLSKSNPVPQPVSRAFGISDLLKPQRYNPSCELAYTDTIASAAFKKDDYGTTRTSTHHDGADDT